MKVIHMITGIGVGGAEKMLLQVVPELEGEHSIISLMDVDDIGKKIEEKGIDVTYMGLRRNMTNIFSVIYKTRKLLKKEQPDLLYCYLIHSNIFGRVIGRMAGVPKIVCSIRNKHIDRKFLNFLDRTTSGLVDLYVPNSEAIVPFLKENQKISEDKIRVIPNGIRMEDYDLEVNEAEKRKEMKVKKENFLISCVAKMQPQKDHETLLEAFAKFKEDKKTKLLLVGDGPLRDELEQKVIELGINKDVLFLGWRKDVPEILQVSDLFVLPSRHEGMSNAILEAMASKVPCIVSDIEENKVLINNEKEGFTFKTGNEKDLRNKMKALYESEEKREKYAEEAYDRVKKEFSLKNTINKYEELLESL